VGLFSIDCGILPKALTFHSHNCLKHGGSCGYPGEEALNLDTPWQDFNQTEFQNCVPFIETRLSAVRFDPGEEALNLDTPSQDFNLTEFQQAPFIETILGASRSDPFNSLPIEMSPESSLLLDHCQSISPLQRISFSCGVPSRIWHRYCRIC
jgi:hypothetical protein